MNECIPVIISNNCALCFDFMFNQKSTTLDDFKSEMMTTLLTFEQFL